MFYIKTLSHICTCEQIIQDWRRLLPSSLKSNSVRLTALETQISTDFDSYSFQSTYPIICKSYRQEAPLTLRGQRGCCRNIKGKPQVFGSFSSLMPHPLFLWVWFYSGPWQTPAACKFEVSSFSRCTNIKGEPQHFEEPPSPRRHHFFLWCHFMIGLGKDKLYAKFEVASFSRCRKIKRENTNFGELP